MSALITAAFQVPSLIVRTNEELKTQTDYITRTISLSLGVPLKTGNKKLLQKMTMAQEESPEISLLEVYGTNGSLLAKLDKSSELPEELIYKESKITSDNEIVGYLKIGINRSRMEKQLHSLVVSLIASLILSTLVFGISGVFIVRRLVGRPMAALKKAALSVSRGEKTKVEMPSNTTQDWQEVALAFNSMSQIIELRDITLKNHAQDLEKLVSIRTQELDTQKMKSLNTAKMAALGEMAAGIAHEVNNPLAIILGHAQSIRRKLGPMIEIQELIENHIHRIEETVQRVSKIVKSLRTFAREGDHDPFTAVPLSRVIDDALDLCRTKAKLSGIEIQVDDQHPGLVAECREVQVGQVLINLLNNAIDAIAKSDDKWVRVTIEQVHIYAIITVTDSGPGIPPEIQQKLMQPFFTTKEVGKGTGLGLSLSKGIMEAHKGTLEYDVNSPTTAFKIILPLQQNESESDKEAA